MEGTIVFDLPDVFFTAENNSFSFFFTTLLSDYYNGTSFSLVVDVVLVDTTTSIVVDVIEAGRALNAPVFNTSTYIPSVASGSFYAVQVFEQTRVLTGLSETVIVSGTDSPTSLPTSTPTTPWPSSKPTTVPTSVPTTDTVTIDLEQFDELVDDFLVRDVETNLTVRLTGDDDRSQVVTIRLCSDVTSSGTTDPCTTLVDTVLVGVSLDETTPFSTTYTIPSSVTANTSYAFVLTVAEVGASLTYLTTRNFLVVAEAPTASPTLTPTAFASPGPTTEAPTLFPTTAPRPISFVDLPSTFFAGEAVNITFRFTDEFLEDADETYLYDAVIIDEFSTVVDVVALSVATSATEVSLEYTPSTDFVVGFSYRVRIIEYVNDYVGLSRTFTYAQSLAPTPEPTTPTIFLEVLDAFGDSVNIGRGDGFIRLGTPISIRFAVTGGLSISSAFATLRLCEGTPSEDDTDLCNADSLKKIIALGLNVTDPTSLTAVSYTVDSDLDIASDYYLAVFVYFISDRRLALLTANTASSADLVFFTPSFTVGFLAPTFQPTSGIPTFDPSSQPSTYLPTARPSYQPSSLPSTAFPSAGPSYAPTSYTPTLSPSSRAPTPAPTTDGPTTCGIIFNPQPEFFGIGATEVTQTIRVCSESGGIFDVILYEGVSSEEIFSDPTIDFVTLASSVSADGSSVDLTFDIPVTLTEGDEYRLRIIEFENGYDAVSEPFRVAFEQAPAPTSNPTAFPTSQGLRLQAFDRFDRQILFDAGDVTLSPGDLIGVQLVNFGNWDFDESKIFVTVRLCADSDCATLFYGIEVFKSTGTSEVVETKLDAGLPTNFYFFEYAVQGSSVTGATGLFGIGATAAPTYGPTTSVSETRIIIRTPSRNWLLGTTVTIDVLVDGIPFGQEGRLDVLLYAAGFSPIAAIATYDAVTNGKNIYSLLVDFPVGSSYSVRAIEYTLGVDVSLTGIDITNVPTIAPTIAPTAVSVAIALEPGPVLLEAGGNDDDDAVLVAGVEYTGTLETRFSYTSATVSICDADEIVDGVCSEIVDTVAYLTPSAPTFTLTPEEESDEAVFQIWATTTSEPAVFITSPFSVSLTTLGPTALEPSRAPTFIVAGLRINHGNLWVANTVEQIDLELLGVVEENTFVDLFLIDAADTTKTSLELLATGAEMVDGSLVLEYTVAPFLASTNTTYLLRALEYTYGFITESENITISANYLPTQVPSFLPTPVPSTHPTSVPPSPAPTASTLTVNVTPPLADIIITGSKLRLDFAYSGSLIGSSGFLTLRVCRTDENVEPYNGPVDAVPYDTCDDVADFIEVGKPFTQSLTIDYDVDLLGTYYFRADSLIDSHSGIVLAYQSRSFTVESLVTASLTSSSDSTSWFKKGEPSRDCAWVAAFTRGDTVRPRCDAKGWDNSFAYDACPTTCDGFSW